MAKLPRILFLANSATFGICLIFALHLIGGIWGALALEIFGELAGLNQPHSQFIGIATVSAFCFSSSWLIFFTHKQTVCIRVDEKEEIEGLHSNEHQVRAYPDFATKD